MAAYNRIRGLKEIVVARGPHSIETWPESDRAYLRERMVAYAKAVIVGGRTIPGARKWKDFKSLVATTPDSWEPSSRPRPEGNAGKAP